MSANSNSHLILTLLVSRGGHEAGSVASVGSCLLSAVSALLVLITLLPLVPGCVLFYTGHCM